MPRQPIRVLATGGFYVLAYVLLTLFGPPLTRSARPVVALLASALPALAAAFLAQRAARVSQGAERTCWNVFTLAACVHAAGQIAFLVQALRPGGGALLLPGHLSYYAFFALSLVAFSARPDRPRPTRLADTAAVEWTMALAGFYFLVFFFGGLPAPGAREGFQVLVLSLQEAVPAAAAMWLAVVVRDAPFRRVYALLAAGYGGALLWGAVGNWSGGRLANALYGPRDAVWMLPFVGLAAAACCPRGALAVGAASPPGRSRNRLAASALVLPPLIDLAARAIGLDADRADERSLVTLTAVVVMSSLLALRIRAAERDGGAAPEPPGGPGAHAARTAHLAFASGVAHELNNPLMAVAGWAEVVHERGDGGPAVARLLEASRGASEAVARLQRVVQAGVAEPPARAGAE